MAPRGPCVPHARRRRRASRRKAIFGLSVPRWSTKAACVIPRASVASDCTWGFVRRPVSTQRGGGVGNRCCSCVDGGVAAVVPHRCVTPDRARVVPRWSNAFPRRVPPARLEGSVLMFNNCFVFRERRCVTRPAIAPLLALVTCTPRGKRRGSDAFCLSHKARVNVGLALTSVLVR